MDYLRRKHEKTAHKAAVCCEDETQYFYPWSRWKCGCEFTILL